MADSGARPGAAITIGQLIAINDEMAALVHAGVPLDRGLLAVGRDTRGRLSSLAIRLGEQLERGESLDSALAAEGRAVPGFYRSVVAAGVRSGRLTSALEGLAVYARNFAETRRAIGLAMVYPILVLMLAYSLFLLFILVVAPTMSRTFETFRFHTLGSLTLFVWLGDHLLAWVPILPVLLLLLLAWWVQSGRAAKLRPGRLSGMLGWIPGFGAIVAEAQAADFADMLALMVDNGVPLDEGIVLSADATGSLSLQKSATRLAEGIRRGDSLAVLIKATGSFPPMLGWVLSTAPSVGSLSPALKHAAETYRLRSSRRAETLKSTLPALMLCVVGAFAAIIYITAVLQPVLTLWYELAIPRND